MPISGWFMVYDEREWSGNRRRMCISRHRQLCVLFDLIFIILWGVIISLVLRRHSSNIVEEPGFKNVKNKHLGMSPF